MTGPELDALLSLQDIDRAAVPFTDSATTEDAGPGVVTVTVLLGTQPESGVLVVFQDAVGAVVSITMFLFVASEPAAARPGKVRVALLVAAS